MLSFTLPLSSSRVGVQGGWLEWHRRQGLSSSINTEQPGHLFSLLWIGSWLLEAQNFFHRPTTLLCQYNGTHITGLILYLCKIQVHTLHQHLCTQVLWFCESRADWARAGALYIKGGWIHWEAPSLMIDSVVMTPLSEPIHIHSLPSSTCQPFFILIQIIPAAFFSWIYSWGGINQKKRRPSVNYAKDLLDQLFLFPGPVWMWSQGDSQQPFSSNNIYLILEIFWYDFRIENVNTEYSSASKTMATSPPCPAWPP